MPNEKLEIVPTDDAAASTDATKATVTLGGVVFVGLAAVGTYVVTKKASLAIQKRMDTRREMKRLYKESKKSAQ